MQSSDKRSKFSIEELEDEFKKQLPFSQNEGTVHMITRRPEIGEREIIEQAILDTKLGVQGDNWSTRGSSRTEDGSSHPEMQITLMNSNIVQIISGTKDRWALAGDQFYVSMDLSMKNLPIGQKLKLGTSIIEVTAQPHTGCRKFVERFGKDSLKFVNKYKDLRVRGVNAKVIVNGIVSTGDKLVKIN